MFLLSSIWKRLSNGIIITFIIGSGFLALPNSAQASGESYTWTDTTDSSITASGGSYASPVQLDKYAPDTQGIPFKGQGMITCGNVKISGAFTLYVDPAKYQKTNPTPTSSLQVVSLCTTASFDAQPNINSPGNSSATATNDNSTPDSCDAGSFTWAVCPLTTQIAKATTSLLSSALTPFLHVQPITQTGTPGLYQTWQGVKNFAEALFIIIFLFIIFATITGAFLDQYTIKRMLPRVVAAAILVQFSFFISAFIVDFGNIFGAGISDVVNAVATGTPHSTGNGWDITSNVIVIVAAFIGGHALWHAGFLSLPVISLLFVAIFAVIITLVARFVLIAALIAISPLAFVAWVLPNTHHYYQKWSSLFIRVILMYPLIMGIFALARIVDQLVSLGGDTASSGVADVAINLLKPFIFIVTFLLVPFAFKWAGGAMTRTHTFMGGVSRAVQGKIRGSESYQRSREHAEARRINRMQHFENRPFVRNLTHTTRLGAAGRARRMAGNGLMSFRAGIMGGAPNTAESIQSSYSKLVESSSKRMASLEETKDPGLLTKILEASYGTDEERTTAMRQLSLAAPSLIRFTQTEAGRMSAIKTLASKGLISDKLITRIQTSSPHEFRNAVRSAGENWKSKPTVVARWGQGEVEFEKDGSVKATHNAGDFKTMAIEGAVKGWDSQSIRSDAHPDNWDMARKYDEISNIMGESIKYTVYSDVLDSNTRTRAQSPKRTEIYKWLGEKQRDLNRAGGNSKQIVETALAKLSANQDIHTDLVKYAFTNTDDPSRATFQPAYTAWWNSDYTQWSDAEKSRYLEDWLKR